MNSRLFQNINTFSKLVYDDEEDGEEEGNVRTYKILGSLEILAIKNFVSVYSRVPNKRVGWYNSVGGTILAILITV